MTSGNKYFKFMDNDDITNNLKCIDHVVFFNTNPKYVLFIHLKIKIIKNIYLRGKKFIRGSHCKLFNG